MNLRARVRAVIPESAFLRRDRGNALYVTDAPRYGFAGAVPGFRTEAGKGLLRLYIKEEILRACAFSPDDVADTLARFEDLSATEEALFLFTEGLKLLEAPDAAGYLAYDKKVRQAAAVALRTGRGGGLSACARLLSEVKRRMIE